MLRPIRPLNAIHAITFGLAFVLAISPALAATAQRTFVASHGKDTDPCSLALPCRSFNAAIAQTNPGGEVVILDTAGYGPMVINKSIKVIGPSGVYGGISVLGGPGAPAPPTTGVVINAGPTDVITLRGLDIAGVPGAAPLPLIGIDVQKAGAVHIEKTSISNFTDPAGGCLKAAPTAPVIVYVDDSMLRECRTGINANGTAESASGDLVVFVDNTRIEASSATSGPAYGLWVQGFAAATMRNSVISISNVGIQFNNIATNGNPILVLSQTQVLGGNTCLNVDNTSAGGVPEVYIDGSQFLGCDDGIVVSNTATGTPFGAQLKITDSKFEHLNNSGITVSAGSDAGVNVDLVRSILSFANNTGISLAAGGTSIIKLNMRDTTLSNAPTLLKTSGTSGIQATLIRSHLHDSGTAVDHGLGKIRMEQTTVTNNANSLVNHGSGIIVSAGIGTAGTNFLDNNADSTPGTVYFTPTVIQMK